MTNRSVQPLERRYRRLLAAYPDAYRRENPEEILAVLMAGAAAGQRRPGLADTASLLRGALGTHLRRLGQGAPQRGWEDALALLSLAVLSYPFALQMTLYLADHGGTVSLLLYPLTRAQQAELYLPPVVLAVAAVVGAVVANRYPARPAGRGRPRPT